MTSLDEYYHIRLKVYGAARKIFLGGVVEVFFPGDFYSFFLFPLSWLTREVLEQQQGPVTPQRLVLRVRPEAGWKIDFNR